MRELTQPAVTSEDIISYEHIESAGMARCLVGVGNVVGGSFIPHHPQTFIMYEMTGDNYNQLVAANESTGKPQGVFRKEDLWPLIDILRSAE